MDATYRHVFDEWFSRYRGRWITLVLVGEIFGGRYGESPQTPRSFSVDKDSVRIGFDTTELLTIVRPSGVLMVGGSLKVHRADRVTFGWHYYGREHLNENWCQKDYRLDGNIIQFEGTGPLLPTSYSLSVCNGDMVALTPA